MTLWKRIFLEKRAVLLPLLLALVANVAAYALIVYPLRARAAGASDRAAAAAQALRDAEQDRANATALVESKSRAEQELSTFYDKVLPPDLGSARRVTYASLPAIARRVNVRYQSGTFEIDSNLKSTRLGLLHVRMVLQGEYENVRQFIYELETADDFVIIDDVTLVQGEESRPLTLTLELSTYFRLKPNGA